MILREMLKILCEGESLQPWSPGMRAMELIKAQKTAETIFKINFPYKQRNLVFIATDSRKTDYALKLVFNDPLPGF